MYSPIFEIHLWLRIIGLCIIGCTLYGLAFLTEHIAFLAGAWASVGSTLGKLTGSGSVVGEGYVIWTALLVAMVVVNTWGMRHYLRSLDSAANSVAPTVISAASSYVLSGIIGLTLFDEGPSVRWWAGATFILLGLGLLAKPRSKLKHTE